MNVLGVVPRSENGYVLSGELTFETVPVAWRETQHLFVDGRSLHFDLANVGRADSAGIALLIEWLRLARQSGARVSYEHMPASILAIARVTGLEAVLSPPAA
ncbi:MAG: STAS domain-containing protein [Pseudomonadota bacterium]